MGAEHDVARSVLEEAHRTFLDNVRDLSLDEALDAGGGYRSILGLIKHTGAWSAVYRSFAFDADPKHWNETDWPRGLSEQIEPTATYLEEVIDWFERSYDGWLEAVAPPVDLASARPVHWGDEAPLRELVAMVAAHWAYHAGEINEILALRREEAWEYGEEVEESHISTIGHGVRPAWMSEEQFERHERSLRDP